MKKYVVCVAFAAAVLAGLGLRAQTAPVARARPPHGAKVSAVFATTSRHFSKDKFNEFNPGLGAEYRLNRWLHAGAGVYYNSLHRVSGYVVAGVEITPARFIGAGVEVGAVSGYSKKEFMMPAGLPYLRVGRRTGAVNAKVGFIPPLKGKTPAVATLQIRVSL